MKGSVKISVVVSGRNSASTLKDCLESLSRQKHPVEEILYFDNGSTDSSREIAYGVAAQSSVPIRVLDGGRDGTLSSAYNRGVAAANGEIVVLCHSDCKIASPDELGKLVAPLLSNHDVAMAFPTQIMPRDIWGKFPFWQKFLFVLAVDRRESTRCGTFDAVRREFYIENGGFNEKRFTSSCGYGGEDSEAYFRFSRLARFALTDALAIHLHALNKNFGFRSYLATRGMLARTYGKMLRWQGGLAGKSDLLVLVRPLLSFLPFCALLFCAFSPLNIGMSLLALTFALQLAFSFMASKKMFLYRETLMDWRIFLVLPATWFMIYFETFWFLQGRFTPYEDEPSKGRQGKKL